MPLASVEANLWSMWSQFGRGPGCTLHDTPDALWFETPIPVPPYNTVVRFHGGHDADRTIDAIFGRFAARGVPFLWVVHPSATPADLTGRLRARGFEDVESLAGMAADLRQIPGLPSVPAGVEIHSVTPQHDVAPFTELVAERWEVPSAAHASLLGIGHSFDFGVAGSPNRAWVAVQGGTALAKAVTHDSGGVVGLYGMATTPRARGMGLGRLLALTALADARSRGMALAVLHSTPMAVSLYRSIGFRDVAPLHVYARRARSTRDPHRGRTIGPADRRLRVARHGAVRTMLHCARRRPSRREDGGSPAARRGRVTRQPVPAEGERVECQTVGRRR